MNYIAKIVPKVTQDQALTPRPQNLEANERELLLQRLRFEFYVDQSFWKLAKFRFFSIQDEKCI